MFDAKKLSQKTILVVGDLMLDQYWRGHAGRISPEAPVPVVHVQAMEPRPGGACNVAINLRTLGAKVILMGIVGTDDSADALIQLLQQQGVELCLLQSPHQPTITKVRILSKNQQLIRLDLEQTFQPELQVELQELFAEQLSKVDAVILSDYAKGTLRNPRPLIRAAEAFGVPVIVDPKRSDVDAYAGASIVTPNEAEFHAMVGACDTEMELIERARALLQQHQLQAILITRGEKGMTLVEESAVQSLPATGGEVYDVTGAGDTVIATFTASWVAGASLHEAMHWANLAAGIVVGKVGTSSVTLQELMNRRKSNAKLEAGVMNLPDLLHWIGEAKAQGERIVMVNGCYDVLHHGHIRYLEKAKSFGDRLVVAVNDDASVKRSKGPGRPLNPLEHRMEVLAGLKAVDWVVAFSEDTPGALIEKVQPDVLVKIKEKFSSMKDIPESEGAHAVIEAGGQVHFLDRTDGVSSTQLIATL